MASRQERQIIQSRLNLDGFCSESRPLWVGWSAPWDAPTFDGGRAEQQGSGGSGDRNRRRWFGSEPQPRRNRSIKDRTSSRSYPSVRGAGTAVIRGQPVQGCEALHPSYIEETKPSTGHETATSDTERRIP